MYAFMLEKVIPAQFNEQIVLFPGMSFRLLTVLTMTAGMAIIMWLAEQITEHGIGNGMSCIYLIILSVCLVTVLGWIGASRDLMIVGCILLAWFVSNWTRKQKRDD